KLNGVVQGRFNATGHIFVNGQGGNDSIRLLSSVIGGKTVKIGVPAVLDGGAGNDILSSLGSKANNILLGGAGNDTVTGGSGRDLLFGGDGRDLLRAGGNSDILVGDRFRFDAALDALLALQAEWTRVDPGSTYATRQNNLFSGGGLNGTTVLNATTIDDDGDVDKLYGQAGKDWFLARAIPLTSKDKELDRVLGEVITRL